jgi:hypothetical protein
VTCECPSCGAHLELVLADETRRAQWLSVIDAAQLAEAQQHDEHSESET